MPRDRGRPAPLFMAHVVPGLEELAWEEIEERIPGARRVAVFSGIDRRAGVLLLRAQDAVRPLLRLRLAEDVFSVVAQASDLPEGRGGLKAIERLVHPSDGLERALSHHAEAAAGRPRRRPTFRIIVRKAGRHAFRRIDAQHVCERALARSRRRWRLVDDEASLEFWLQIVGRTAVFALRLSSVAMRQRSYRGVSLRAALKPTIACALVRLASPGGRGLMLDPMCGAGTVLAEAAARGLRTVGGDASGEVTRAARTNVGLVGNPGSISRWDATRLPLRNAVADAVACNLPWGRQQQHRDLAGLYAGVVREARRVARPGARIVLLTSERDLMDRVLRRQRRVRRETLIKIAVRGANAYAFVLLGV